MPLLGARASRLQMLEYEKIKFFDCVFALNIYFCRRDGAVEKVERIASCRGVLHTPSREPNNDAISGREYAIHPYEITNTDFFNSPGTPALPGEDYPD